MTALKAKEADTCISNRSFLSSATTRVLYRSGKRESRRHMLPAFRHEMISGLPLAIYPRRSPVPEFRLLEVMAFPGFSVLAFRNTRLGSRIFLSGYR